MYTEIRQCMAADFPKDFGPEIVQELRKDKMLLLSAILVLLYPSAPNSIIAVALGTRLCM